MKNYFIKPTVIIALLLAIFTAFTTLTYADGNVYKKGERSKEIAEIQRALKDLKLFNEEITGYFGEATESSVKKFQALHKLAADGVVGSSTLKALFGKSSITPTSRAVIERKKVNVTYTIKEGDTIWDIADEFNVSRDSILKYNNLTEESVLKIGKKITIPNVVKVVVKISSTEEAKPQPDGQTVKATNPPPAPVVENNNEVLADVPDGIYIVKEGDTLYSIAEDYGIAVKSLAELNGLTEEAVLEVDKEIKIPDTAIADQTPNSNISTENVQLKGELLGWYDKVQYLFEKNDVAVVTDVKTGKVFKIKRLYGRNHADVEPLTKEDTAVIKSLYGSWSWDRRAIIVNIDGHNIAASMNGMPHGGQQINDNDFQGHFCVHFKNSKTHKGNRMDATHQAAVKLAAGIK